MDAPVSSGDWGRASDLPLFRRTLLPSELHRNGRDAGRSRTCFGSGCSRPPDRPAPASSRKQSQRWDSNPLGPPYESGARPVGRRRQLSGWPGGVEPARLRFTAGVPASWVRPQSPWQESNLHDLRLRRAACFRHTPGMLFSTPARNRTWTCSFGGSHDVRFTTRARKLRGMDLNHRHPGSEPGVLPLNYPAEVPVTREGVEPSRRGGHGLLRTACLPVPPPGQFGVVASRVAHGKDGSDDQRFTKKCGLLPGKIVDVGERAFEEGAYRLRRRGKKIPPPVVPVSPITGPAIGGKAWPAVRRVGVAHHRSSPHAGNFLNASGVPNAAAPGNVKRAQKSRHLRQGPCARGLGRAAVTGSVQGSLIIV